MARWRVKLDLQKELGFDTARIIGWRYDKALRALTLYLDGSPAPLEITADSAVRMHDFLIRSWQWMPDNPAEDL